VTQMGAFDPGFSRISKLILDRDQLGTDAVLARRQKFGVTLACGDDVAASRTLQVAVLTAASIACRCFPGAVRTAMSSTLAQAPLLVWPQLKLTFGEAAAEILQTITVEDAGEPAAPRALIFGNALPTNGALRLTFDGWVAKVGPAQDVVRLQERDYFSAAGVLAASLALSELFLSFAEIDIEATRRVVGLSLWRPDLDIGDGEALGIPVEYLPSALWVLGLGHLGNAYLWSLATLPYADPREVEFALLDFDKVKKENIETGVVFSGDLLGHFKTRACNAWLDRRGFQTRMVERRFDSTFRVQEKEPALALCGFDSNAARRDLSSARFQRGIETGVGGMANNFDTISFHTLPNPRAPEALWPDMDAKEKAKLAAYEERMAQENPGYVSLGGEECGRRQHAGEAVAVPFVGTTAASLVVAEAVRLLHEGPAYFDMRLNLGNLAGLYTHRGGNYAVRDAAGLPFVTAKQV
jgi:hypothetical protein